MLKRMFSIVPFNKMNFSVNPKYSLVYIVKGKRVIGYDNAEGKGDHRHYGDKEEVYTFKSVDKLFEDFYNDIKRVKKHES